MLVLNHDQAALLRRAVASARSRPGIAGRVHQLHHDLQDAIDARRPRCDLSGRCCRFDDFGHVLMVTTAELAVFIDDLGTNPPTVASAAQPACPFQKGKLCGVHTVRPLGCRIFFCDPTAVDWQRVLYEQLHHRLRSLHDEFGLAYFYVEWRQGLAAVTSTSTPADRSR